MSAPPPDSGENNDDDDNYITKRIKNEELERGKACIEFKRIVLHAVRPFLCIPHAHPPSAAFSMLSLQAQGTSMVGAVITLSLSLPRLSFFSFFGVRRLSLPRLLSKCSAHTHTRDCCCLICVWGVFHYRLTLSLFFFMYHCKTISRSLRLKRVEAEAKRKKKKMKTDATCSPNSTGIHP